MGPIWYWMPDIFEQFFSDFGYSSPAFHKLKLLGPSFGLVFSDDDTLMNVPSDFDELCKLFESVKKGGSVKLRALFREAEYKYIKRMNEMAYKPGLSIAQILHLLNPYDLKN